MIRRTLYAVALAFALISVAGAAPKKVACIGDSITFGARIKNRGQNSYPVQMGKLLGKDYEVKNFGVNAATLLKKGNKPYWKLGQYKAALVYKPDIVVIKLGTNDTKPDNWKHKAEFVDNYVEMIESFQKLDSKPKVYICYPVPAYPERWGISDKTIKEEVKPLLDKIAKQAGAKIIDLYSALSDKAELFPDKIHPNAKGAGIMAETIAAAITGKPVVKDAAPK